LQQAGYINSSLSALADVISSLLKKSAHVPFRNSALTKVLRKNICESSKTIILGCLSPAKNGEREAYNTVKFLQRAMVIKTMPVPNDLRNFRPHNDEEVEKLKSRVNELEKDKQELRSQNEILKKQAQSFQSQTKKQTPAVTTRQYALYERLFIKENYFFFS
jgi:kinesin family member 11